ncbi:MAG: LPS export ABC transporter permease LptF [Gammaproteobacteria bacterium]|nr:LPS export ABC transporter permease LptF [Gammaproteobacteria bacterium]MCW8987808.1 LPS export ABC transporter permease LptF [Gammaproteobacteria bacterium]MCW9032198.1 LPS export ABC transporter permease LptF [Gammaproteobacteria bacterium]
MIIARYLIKEIAQTLFAVCLVLMIIGLSGQLVDIFSDVANGTLSINTVIVVLGLKSLKMLMVILPLSLYLAVLMTLSRFYQNNEMAAISASGISQLFIMKIVVSFAFLFTIFIGIFSFQIIPWANGLQQEINLKTENATELEGMVAGRFRESSAGVGVMYIEGLDEKRTQMQGVFVQQHLKNNAELVIRANKGRREMNKKTGDRFMVLEDGVRYQTPPGKLDYTVIEFEEHGVRVQEKILEITQKKQTAMPTLELIKMEGSIYKAEFHSRLAPVILCLLLSALAVPLSQTSPRQGQYLRLGIGLLIYVVVTNLINIGKTWVAFGKVPSILGLWWVHAILLTLVIILLMQQVGFRYLFSKGKQ